MKEKTSSILWGVACLVLFTGCSAGKNTTGTRAYHELTTRYNIFFNAEEAYYEILKERSENFREDYAEVLPFYPSTSAAEKPVSGGPFDPVIDKTGKAIREHSITAKPRRDPTKAPSQEYRQWLRRDEFNPFLKNVWLLRGKAFLQNGNHDQALSVFSGMLRLFSYDTGLTDETEIWLLRTYAEMGRTYDAEKTAYALKSKRLPGHLEKLFNEHYTYFLIRKKEFAEAIPHLRKTIEKESDYSRKKRLQFLLGQIYAITGEEGKACHAFEEVKGIRTPFELTLNATIWQSALTSGGQQHTIMRRLKKMEQKINDTDSLMFSNQRYRIYLKTGNDSLAQAFRPPEPDNDAAKETTTAAAVTDSTAGNLQGIENTPQRLSQGRTLAENAALHRQWQSRNGLWQSRPAGSTESTESTETGKDKMAPFSANRNGPHYLLLTFTPGSADKNRLLFTTADFNFSHFKLRRFNFSYIYLSASEALQIEPFGSFEEVSRYTEMMRSDSLFRTALPVGITPVIISEENLKTLRSGERMDEYNLFYAESIAPVQRPFQPVRRDETAEIEEKSAPESEKIVSLKTSPATIPEQKEVPAQPEPIPQVERVTPEALKRRLEQNAAKALQQQQETTPRKSREELLKEREQQREKRIRQREREMKEKLRKREAALKQRERERELR
ncbi:cell envelope integrity protein TolA [uncultured Proteiniphilum sp.]|uniref:cell envelope integrity protein TolA n=1 Tax=uncultured Proteiniphilum sp. TaxID=497637 RepID=UPI002629A390|nr:cell envelope integrity protein TolA [uncultured Proteiniphilum sp.]